MPKNVQVAPGATVEASDGMLGIVDEVILRPGTGELAYLVVRLGSQDEPLTIPAQLIQSITSPTDVRLTGSRQDVLARGADSSGDWRPSGGSGVVDQVQEIDDGGELRIPVHEERLVTNKRQVEYGELRIHKRVEQREEVITQALTRDDLIVERVQINRALDAPVSPRDEGDWLVIPIMEEVLVIQKRLMLKEEVRIRKQQITEEQQVREVVRREHVDLEDATTYGITGLESKMSRRPDADVVSRSGLAAADSDATLVAGGAPPIRADDAVRP